MSRIAFMINDISGLLFFIWIKVIDFAHNITSEKTSSNFKGLNSSMPVNNYSILHAEKLLDLFI